MPRKWISIDYMSSAVSSKQCHFFPFSHQTHHHFPYQHSNPSQFSNCNSETLLKITKNNEGSMKEYDALIFYFNFKIQVRQMVQSTTLIITGSKLKKEKCFPQFAFSEIFTRYTLEICKHSKRTRKHVYFQGHS